MTPRLFVPQALVDAAPGNAFTLPPDIAHHLRRVLRRKPGDAVVLFDGEGRSADALVAADVHAGAAHARHAETRVLVRQLHAREPRPALAIGLAQGISAAEKMDWTIEKAVELGVSEIVPLQCARSVVRLVAARSDSRMLHWQRLIAASCAQCGRNRLPSLAPPTSFEDWIDRLGAPTGDTVRIHLDPHADRSLPAMLSALPAPPSHVVLACGPEGGFEANERQRLQASGWHALRLGPRVLRTETAAMTAVAMIQGWLGDLR